MVWNTAEALVQDLSVELLPQRETMITKPASRLSRLKSQYFPDVAFPRQQMAFAGEHKGRGQYTHTHTHTHNIWKNKPHPFPTSDLR